MGLGCSLRPRRRVPYSISSCICIVLVLFRDFCFVIICFLLFLYCISCFFAFISISNYVYRTMMTTIDRWRCMLLTRSTNARNSFVAFCRSTCQVIIWYNIFKYFIYALRSWLNIHFIYYLFIFNFIYLFKWSMARFDLQRYQLKFAFSILYFFLDKHTQWQRRPENAIYLRVACRLVEVNNQQQQQQPNSTIEL